MIDFKKVTLEDKYWMDNLIKKANYEGSNFNFSNIYLWDNSFSQSVAEVDGFLVIKHINKNGMFYAAPLGDGELKKVVLSLKADAAERGEAFALKGLLADTVIQLKELFGNDTFTFTPNRDRFDYVYNIEKLCSLSGKKLQSKRNHINKFIEANTWSFENITCNNILYCKEMSDKWFAETLDDNDEHSLKDEHIAIDRAFEHYFDLGLEGGFLSANGKVVAYTFGEQLTDDMYVIHFEKAFKEINGAYPMVNREFSRYIFNRYSNIRHINREEDMGLEGLRRAKLSYRPDFFVEKYTAEYMG